MKAFLANKLNCMAIVADGKKIAAEILADLKKRVALLNEQGIEVSLAVVLVGEDKPSQTYVRNKGKACAEVGINFLLYEFPTTITTEALIGQIQKIQTENKLSGLIVQLPLPAHIASKKVINCINPEVDVDCLTFFNLGKLLFNQSTVLPPTPSAMLEFLKYHQIDWIGKYVVMLGRGELIGKPLSSMLAHEPVTLSICNRSTPDLSVFTKNADIIFTGVGKHNLLTGEMIREGAVVIDAGVCFVDGQMYGDIEFETVNKKASLVTPTPGGVGPVTVAKLLANTVRVAETCSLIKLK
ncbi:MAG: tetrahydrofolate dehydrogenase/cyclohydrolase catalytic domain-containing protein [Patescibacteria group bacterium]